MPRNKIPLQGFSSANDARHALSKKAAMDGYDQAKDRQKMREVDNRFFTPEPYSHERAEKERAARTRQRRASRAIKSVEQILVDPDKPQAVGSNIRDMVEDLRDINILREQRHTLHILLNDEEYDVVDMEPHEKAHYRKNFLTIYEGLSDDIDILEILAMANVRIDLLTKNIAELLGEFEMTFGVKIIDDWER